MTDSLTVNADRAADVTTDDDDIASELYFSAREAGVACFAIPVSEVAGESTRPPG